MGIGNQNNFLSYHHHYCYIYRLQQGVFVKMFLIPGDYLKLVLQGSYMSNADKIKLSGPNKEKFLQDIKVRNWMIKRYLLSICRLSKSNSHPNIQSTF